MCRPLIPIQHQYTYEFDLKTRRLFTRNRVQDFWSGAISISQERNASSAKVAHAVKNSDAASACKSCDESVFHVSDLENPILSVSDSEPVNVPNALQGIFQLLKQSRVVRQMSSRTNSWSTIFQSAFKYHTYFVICPQNHQNPLKPTWQTADKQHKSLFGVC